MKSRMKSDCVILSSGQSASRETAIGDSFIIAVEHERRARRTGSILWQASPCETHFPDQLANFKRHLWPAAARPRLPSPEPAYFLPNQFCEAVLKSSLMSRKRAALIRRGERSQSPHERPSARTA